MKKMIFVLTMSILLVASLSAAKLELDFYNPNQSTRSTSYRNAIMHTLETFESGMGDWYHIDGSGTMEWNLTNDPFFASPTGGGYSWWAGMPGLGNHGGHKNRQLIYFQSPQIAITSSNTTASFRFKQNIEKLEVYDLPPLYFDGWDGFNVRISTNGGTSWTVIEPVSPAYNATSMYCWYYMGEDADIPGWGGPSADIAGADAGGWVPVALNLTPYVGQNIILRWVFGADPGFCTLDDYDIWGVVVDDIAIAGTSYSFSSATALQNFTTGTIAPFIAPTGNLWDIKPYAHASSPTNVMMFANDAGTYLPNMQNFIYSDMYTLPTGGSIYADFQFHGQLRYVSASNYHFLRWSIYHDYPDGQYRWHNMSNPISLPDLPNFVYVWSQQAAGGTPLMGFFTDSFGLDGDITELAGRAVRFRWEINSNDATPLAHQNFKIDDLTIRQVPFTPEPRDLIITSVDTDNNVSLSWRNPTVLKPFEEGWVQLCSNIPATSYGHIDNDAFGIATRFSPLHLIDLSAAGGKLTKVSFFPNEATTYRFQVYTGGVRIASPGVLVWESEEFTLTEADLVDWYDIVLETPIDIPTDSELRLAVLIAAFNGHPATVDNTPRIQGFGNLWININETTGRLTWSAPGTDGNWMMRGYAEDADGNPIMLSASPEHFYTSEEDDACRLAVISARSITRNLALPENHRVYTRTTTTGTWIQLIELDGDMTTYIHTKAEEGFVNYYAVTSIYDGFETDRSNVAFTFIPSAEMLLCVHDNGTANTQIPSGTGAYLNRFDPTDFGLDAEKYRIQWLSVYVTPTPNTSTPILKIFRDNGGLPGDEVYSQNISNMLFNFGWNYFRLNQTPGTLHDKGSSFFIGFQTMGDPPFIGIDTVSTVGNSFFRTGTAQNPTWNPLTTGTYMIRAYVTPSDESSENELTLIPSRLRATNYPNPFNPQTTISYQMPEKGHVSIQVYNVKGQLVSTIFDDEVNAGPHSIIWDGLDAGGKSAATGIYFYKITTTNESIVNKMVLLK